jgi:hypothetical protein
MNNGNVSTQRSGRREFLAQVSAAAVAGLIAGGTSRAAEEPTPAAATLPTVKLGPHSITRLIAGWNPIGGYSYMGHDLDREMKDYFTTAHTVEFLRQCERAGINTHQFSPAGNTAEVLRLVREGGSAMQFFGLHAGREGVKGLVESTQPIALAHHGGVTDSLFREGNSQVVHDYLKAVHDCGVLAGVSAHNPDCIKRAADEGWEADFFMGCFYYLTRPDKPQPDGRPPVVEGPDVGYSFYAADPLEMTAVARQVKQPCFGFKILAAGRACKSQDTVREAFRLAFSHLKPTDAVIVGMYPRHADQPSENAQMVRELCR